jgi:hypothetical protein
MNFIEEKTDYGNIYIYESVVPIYICDELIKYIDEKTEGNVFIDDEDKSKNIITILKDCLNFPFKLKNALSKLTLIKSMKPIPIHQDKVYENEKYKLVIYLNDVKNGGTYFQKNNKEFIYVENKVGSVVIFDMNIPHYGNKKQENKLKYLIGLRLIEC